MDRLYTCAEVAERYGVKKRTVWEWIRTGKLRAVRVGKLYRVYESDLKAFENGKEVTA